MGSYIKQKFIMSRYKQQLNIALERLDQGLYRLKNQIKRGNNQEALRFMGEELKELYTELQDLVNLERDDKQTGTGFLR